MVDSILSLVKVKRFPGSNTDDLSHHIIPIIQTKPTNISIHVETNETHCSTCKHIRDNLLKLKSLVKKKIPQCKVWLWPLR